MDLRKALVLISALIMLTTSAFAAWTIDASIHPQSISQTSLLLAQINDSSGKSINPSNCTVSGTNTASVTYEFGENVGFFTYLSKSGNTWYAIDTLTANNLTIKGQGSCYGSADTRTLELALSGSDGLEVSILNNFTNPLPQSSNLTLMISVMLNSYPDPIASLVYGIIHPNGTREEGQIGFEGYNSEENRFEKEIILPQQIGDLLIWVESEIQGNNTTIIAGDSKKAILAENIDGSITLEHSENKCNSDVSQCETGATVSVNFTKNVGSPDSIVLIANSSNVLETVTMTNLSQNTWTANLTIPENTTSFQLEVNASNNVTSKTFSKGIVIVPFSLNILKKNSVSPGDSLKMQVEIFKPFSGTHLNSETVEELNLSITDKDGKKIINFTKTSFTFQNDLFEVTYGVPVDAEDAEYGISAAVLDSQGNKKTFSTTFKVASKTVSGPLIINISSINKEFNEEGSFKEYILYNNTDSSSVVVQTVITGNVSNITFGEINYDEKNNDESVLIPAKSTKAIALEFNISDLVAYYEGKLIVRAFTNLETAQEKFRAELPVKINILRLLKNDTIGAIPSSFEENLNENGIFTKELEIFNLDESSVNVSLSTQGSASSLLDFNQSRLELDSKASGKVKFTYSVTDTTPSGDNSGFLVLYNSVDTLKIPVSIILDRQAVNGELQLIFTGGSHDFGTVIAGTLVTRTLNLTNVGKVTVSNLDISSNLDSLTIDPLEFTTLEPNQSISTEMTIDTSQVLIDDTFNPTIRATGSGSTRTELSFQIKIYQDYGQKLTDLESQIRDLRTRASSSNNTEIDSDLDSLESLITEGKSLFSEQKYEDAKSSFSDANELKRAIDVKLVQSEKPVEEEQNKENNDGGGNNTILIFVVVFVVLLLIGVVVYLSIVPSPK